tara:strand:+ start:414 stop:1100 length:687 start_codon:yes stop_codon:yes gene_type:complete
MEIIIFFFVLGFVLISLGKYGESLSKKENQKSTILKDQTKQPSTIPDEILEQKFDEVIEKLSNGYFSKEFESSLMLKKGERLVFDLPGITYCQEKTIKFKGNHQGFSVRIMKGVSYRFGGFEGGSEQKVVPIDEGSLILTNKRFVFSGSSKSIEFPLSKIVTIDPLDDGIMINRTGKTKMEYYLNTTNFSVLLKIYPEEGENFKKDEVTYSMTGFELKKLVQKLLQDE